MKTMRHVLSAFLFAALTPLCGFAVPHHAQAGEDNGNTDERAAIAAVIDTYIEGGKKGSGEVMKAAFVDGANIYSARFGGPIQALFDLVDGHPAEGIVYTIANLDIIEDIAMARVEIDNWSGAKYTDMFTLIKTADGWRIASKVSHRY